jgi:hypothetical protein
MSTAKLAREARQLLEEARKVPEASTCEAPVPLSKEERQRVLADVLQELAGGHRYYQEHGQEDEAEKLYKHLAAYGGEDYHAWIGSPTPEQYMDVLRGDREKILACENRVTLRDYLSGTLRGK